MRKEEGNHAFRLLVLIIVFFGNAYRIDVARIVLLPHITTLCAAGTVQKIEIHTAAMTILQSILSTLNRTIEYYVDHTPLRSSKHFQRGVRDWLSILSLLLIMCKKWYEDTVR